MTQLPRGTSVEVAVCECGAEVPAHLVTLPFRGYGVAGLWDLGREDADHA